MITVLAGGVGAARLLAGLVHVVPRRDVTAIVNVGDDIILHGLHISPDLDTVTYTLAERDRPRTRMGLARRDVERDGDDRTTTAASDGSTSATATSARTCTARDGWRRARSDHRHPRDHSSVGPRADVVAGDRRPPANVRDPS